MRRTMNPRQWPLLLLLAACGGETDHGPGAPDAADATTRDGTAADSGVFTDSAIVPESGTFDSARETGTLTDSGWVWGDGSEPYPIVPPSGTCGPQTGYQPEGCCANTIPCMGFCVTLPGGQVGCDCYGIRGGCWPDATPNQTVCCPNAGGCTTPSTCYSGM